MSERDSTEEFLQNLPEVKKDELFKFACHPDVRCFNACCSDLNLMLTPYDVLRLRRGLDMESKEFLQAHCEIGAFPDTGFPAMHLRMQNDSKRRCPYVTANGCSVYENRPAACRTYPIGRAVRDTEDGPLVQYFLVQESHCDGFEENKEWTVDTWTADQGLEPYNESNDRFSRLLSRQKSQEKVMETKQTNMVFLALYQVDNFTRFIEGMNVFSRLSLTDEQQQAIMQDEEKCLEFAFDWVELLLFGDNERLQPK